MFEQGRILTQMRHNWHYDRMAIRRTARARMHASLEVGAVVAQWVPDVLAAANGEWSRPGGGFVLAEPGDLRHILEGVISAWRGEVFPIPELPTQYLPRVGVGFTRGVRVIEIERPPYVPAPEEPLLASADHVARLSGVATALLIHPNGALLRRCDWPQCGRFFLARSNHQRAHSFCCEAHRRAYDVAHRDPAIVAKYMRGYRQGQKVARRRKRPIRAGRK